MPSSARGHPIRPRPRVFRRPVTLCRRASWAVVADDRRKSQPSSVIDRRNARRADAVSAASYAAAVTTDALSAVHLDRPQKADNLLAGVSVKSCADGESRIRPGLSMPGFNRPVFQGAPMARARLRETAQPRQPTMQNGRGNQTWHGLPAHDRQSRYRTPLIDPRNPQPTLRRRASWAGVADDRPNSQPPPVIGRRNARRADAVSATSCRHSVKDRERSAKRVSKAVAEGDSKRLTILRRRASWADVVDDRRNTQPSSVIDRPNARRAAAVSATSYGAPVTTDALSATTCRHPGTGSQ
jgi:hypothetical protein